MMKNKEQKELLSGLALNNRLSVMIKSGILSIMKNRSVKDTEWPNEKRIGLRIRAFIFVKDLHSDSRKSLMLCPSYPTCKELQESCILSHENSPHHLKGEKVSEQKYQKALINFLQARTSPQTPLSRGYSIMGGKK